MVLFFRYLLGFLTISFGRKNAEALLNCAAKNNIKLWNLKYQKDSILGNISIKDFKKLRSAKRGTSCRLKIIKKHGFIFKIEKHSDRTGIWVGFVLFALILIFLSNFVWIVKIEGNKHIKNKEIIDSCKKIGIYEGMRKTNINNKYDAQKLLLKQKGLSWCALNLEGCVLTVNLSEVEKSDKENRKNPVNLKANIDGQIKKINVTSGNVLIKVGDFVSKEQLLVSGVVEKNSSVLFVHSEGEVIAETQRTFSAFGEFKQIIKQPIIKKTKRYSLEFFTLKIPLFLGTIKGEFDYSCNIKKLKLFNNPIPIKLATESFVFTEKVAITYDKKSLEEKLFNDIAKQIKSYKFESCDEISREKIETEKGLLLKINYTCQENIAVEDKIIINNEN